MELGAAVIGLGFGWEHARSYARMPGVVLKQVCDVSADKLSRVSNEWPKIEVTDSVAQVAENPAVSVVSVCTFDHLHFEHASHLISAGKNVLIEKPMTVKREDAATLVRLAHEHGVTVGVGNVNRFEPRFANIHSLSATRRLGSVFMVESEYLHDMRGSYASTSWRSDAVNPQCFWLGGAVHPMDLARWIGGDVSEVFMYSRGSVLSPDEFRLPTEFVCLLKFESGALGRVSASAGICQRPHHTVTLRVMGDRGTAIADLNDPCLRFCLPEEIESQAEFANVRTANTVGHPIFEELSAFVECVRTGSSPRTDVLDGAKTVATLTAALESARIGKPVAVDNRFD